MNKSEEFFKRAKKVIPGGVNSPVRAFNSVKEGPIFIKSANGAHIFDENDNKYLDYIGSWGPMILGHNNEIVNKKVKEAVDFGLSFGACTKLEVEMAEIITNNIKCVDMVRMVNSGTEAVMSAIRLSRGYTKKDKVIKFEGCYHGHCDSMLVKSGSGTLSLTSPNSEGVPRKAVEDTLIATYNDINSVKDIFSSHKGEIASVIVEPVSANMGVISPENNFLKELRELCDQNNALLIFDEVITGFRLSFGGASEYFGVEPDLVTYGKIIGGGMPVGAYGGKLEIMECVAPSGNVYQAGTLSGNPIAMTAGLETLKQLLKDKSIYSYVNDLGKYMGKEIRKITNYTVNDVGSLCCLFFKKGKVLNYKDVQECDTKKYEKMFTHLIENNIYIAPAQYEAMFMSVMHEKKDVDYTVTKIKEILEIMGD